MTAVVDVATLTGACIIALGKEVCPARMYSFVATILAAYCGVTAVVDIATFTGTCMIALGKELHSACAKTQFGRAMTVDGCAWTLGPPAACSMSLSSYA